MSMDAPPRPLWMKLDAGEPLTRAEWCRYVLVRFTNAIGQFAWKVKITPALRERCIDKLIAAGAKPDVWSLRNDADDLAAYIASGKKP